MQKVDLKKERERRRREAYKEIILHAAEALILRGRYQTMTMDDIAREARLSKATLYRYVSGKRDLVFHIIIHYYDDQKKALTEIAAGKGRAADKLKAAIRLSLEASERQMSVTRLFMTDRSAIKIMKHMAVEHGKCPSSPSAAFFKTMKARRDEVMDIGRAILDEGIASGEFRTADPAGAVSFIYALVEGLLHVRFWMDCSTGNEAETDKIFGFIFQGIRNPEPSRKGDRQ
jgi:AcrR family transcriptional regulator